MKRLLHFGPGLLFVFGVCIPAFCQDPCSLKVDKDSIQVYSCKLPNSKFKAVKSVFPISSRLGQLAAMVMDIENYREWQKETVTARILERVSDHEIIYYYEAAAPYPASNRDFVIRLTMEQNPKTKELIIHAVSVPEYIPHKPNIIRVPFSEARWNVKSIKPGQLLVEYHIEIDLGGAVPPWLINMVSHQAPHDTFKAMREHIGKYKESKVGFVVE
jgi:hypothetical protein